MYSRRTLCAATAMLLVFVAATPATGAGIPDRLAVDTDVLVTIANLEHLYEVFGIAQARSADPERSAELAEELVEKFAIDLLDPAALRAAGVHVDRPIHVAVYAEPAPVTVAFVPAEATVVDLIEERVSAEGPVGHEVVAGVRLSMTDDDRTAFFHVDGHLVCVVAREPESAGAVERARRLLAGGQARLADDPRFNAVRGRIATGADVDVFMTADFQRKLNEASPEDLAERGLSPEQFEEMYYAFGGRDGVSAYASTVERQRITVEGYVLIGEGVPVLDWYRVDVDPVAFLSRLAASPWLALVGRVDAAAMWGSLRPILAAARPDTAPSLDDALAEFREETGTDVEKDIIGQIDGNVGLLVGRVAMMGPDAILFVQLRDVARAQETLDRATARIRRTLEEARSDPNASARARSTTLTEVSQGNTTFQQLGLGPIGAVCYGIVDDHLVVTASAERYRLILTGNSGLFDGVDNAAVATALRDPGSTVMYLDFEGLARDLSGFVPMIGPKVGPVMAALEALDDLVATSTVGEDGVRQTFELRASDADAWPMLMAFLLELGVGDDDAGMRHD